MFSIISFLISFVVVFQVSSVLALVLPRSSVIDCPRNRLTPADRRCIPFVGNKDISGISFSLYTWTKPDGSGSPVADAAYLEPLQSAAAKALPVFAPLMQEKPRATRVFLTEDLGDRGQTDVQDPDRSTCNVRVMGPGVDTKYGDIYSMQKTLVHELYHCVQRSYGSLSPNRPWNNWWDEGAAEYFGNVFYPAAKSSHMPSYNPRQQLFTQKSTDGYAASLFWQHLSNTFTPDIAIHNYVTGRLDSSSDSAEEEQKRLTTDSFITKAFPSFATQYFDGKIVYNLSAGEPVPSIGRGLIKAYQETIKPQVGITHITMSVLSWAIWETTSMTFPSNRLVSFTWQPSDPQDTETVLQYRKSTETTWKTISKGKKVDVESSCSQYTFLGTSTRDTDMKKTFPITVTVTVKKKSKKQNKRDVDPAPSDSPAENNTEVTDPAETSDRITFIPDPDSEPDDDDDVGNCSVDKCIIGNWNLDLSGMQAYLSKAMTGLQDEITISNLAVTGSVSFSVSDTLLSSMLFKNLAISYDGSVPSVPGSVFHTVIDNTGSVIGPITLSGDNVFTWVNPTTEGWIKSKSTVPGLSTPIELDFPTSNQYGPDTQVQYTCQDSSLEMTGYVDGGYAWAFTWKREVVA